MGRPILCLDFDGVINSYKSGWVEPDFIPDPPVDGALNFLVEALKHFDVCIFSSRSKSENGIRAMRTYIKYWATKLLPSVEESNHVINAIVHNANAFPTNKPSAFVTIDDRALTFDGTWPDIEKLRNFKPWNKK